MDQMIGDETVVKTNCTSRFESKIRELEDRLKKTIQNEENCFRNIGEQLSKLEQILNQQKATRELIEEKKRKEVKAAESNANLEVV